MNIEKRIPIMNKATGKVCYSAPVQPQIFSGARENASVLEERPLVISTQVKTDKATTKDKGVTAKNKPKPEITTLEKFIEYAYGKKGQKLSLTEKIVRNIASNIQLSADVRARLLKLAESDEKFCVPRQILLTARDIEGYPLLKAALRAFVQDVMLSHPIFNNSNLHAVIRNLPDAPPPHAALKLVMAVSTAQGDSEISRGKKSTEFEDLKLNAAHCLAVWLTEIKNLPLVQVTDALNDAIWLPASRQVLSEDAKLRALTETEHAEGVGLACEMYRQQAREKALLAVDSNKEATDLRRSLSEFQQLFEVASSDLDMAKTELEQVRKESAQTLKATQTAAETQSAHLRDDLQQLRSRVLRRLISDIDSLEVGLSALQSPEPRIHVIQDRVERVIDALRSEINKLKEG